MSLGSAEHTARALELYQEIVAADQDPDYVRSALFQLGRIHYQQEDFKQAIAAYESILQEYSEAPQRHGAVFRTGSVLPGFGPARQGGGAIPTA